MKKILEDSQRLALMKASILAANQINKYKVYLSELRDLKKKHRILGVSTLIIELKEEEYKKKIEKLNVYISTRFNILLQDAEKKIFCESYLKEDGSYGIFPKSITESPIDQIGTLDIKRGYIILTRIKKYYNSSTSIIPSRLELIPLKIDLQTTIITENFSKEI